MTTQRAALATEKTLRKVSRKEMNATLKLMGLQEKPKTKAVIIRLDRKSASSAVEMLRNQGIVVMYERYAAPDKLTILKKDLEKAEQLLAENGIECQKDGTMQ